MAELQDIAVLQKLMDAWNLFLVDVPEDRVSTDDDIADFGKAIHDAQRIVFTRALKRGEREKS